MRVSRTKARRGAAGGLRNHGLLSLANGPFQGSQNADLRRPPQDLDRQNSKVCAPREGESAMKKGPDADVPPSAPTSNSSSRTHVACAVRLTSRSKARQGNPKAFATAVMLSRMPSCDGHPVRSLDRPPCSPGKPTRFPGRQKPSQFRSVSEACGGLRTESRPFSLFCAQNRPPVSARKIPFPGPRDGEAGAEASRSPNFCRACAGRATRGLLNARHFRSTPSSSRRRPMRTTAGGEIDAGLSKRRRRRKSYDESVDEPAKLVEIESVEVEAEVPAEENEPVETVEREDKPETSACRDRIDAAKEQWRSADWGRGLL